MTSEERNAIFVSLAKEFGYVLITEGSENSVILRAEEKIFQTKEEAKINADRKEALRKKIAGLPPEKGLEVLKKEYLALQMKEREIAEIYCEKYAQDFTPSQLIRLVGSEFRMLVDNVWKKMREVSVSTASSFEAVGIGARMIGPKFKSSMERLADISNRAQWADDFVATKKSRSSSDSVVRTPREKKGVDPELAKEFALVCDEIANVDSEQAKQFASLLRDLGPSAGTLSKAKKIAKIYGV